MAFVVPHPGIKPNCISSMLTCVLKMLSQPNNFLMNSNRRIFTLETESEKMQFSFLITFSKYT